MLHQGYSVVVPLHYVVASLHFVNLGIYIIIDGNVKDKYTKISG